jgi:hypothetical protein
MDSQSGLPDGAAFFAIAGGEKHLELQGSTFSSHSGIENLS